MYCGYPRLDGFMESDVVTVAMLNIKILKIYLLKNTPIFVFICDNLLILAK